MKQIKTKKFTSEIKINIVHRSVFKNIPSRYDTLHKKFKSYFPYINPHH